MRTIVILASLVEVSSFHSSVGISRKTAYKHLERFAAEEHGIEAPTACSTIGELLRRHGLSARRRRRPGAYPSAHHGLTEPTQPNHVWTVDFKGWFLLGDGQRCDPPTVSDLYSHFVIGLKAQPNQQFKGTLRSFRGLVCQAGKPEIIRGKRRDRQKRGFQLLAL